MYISFEDDRGGNNIDVTGSCSSNLHSAWGTCLVLRAIGADPSNAATEHVKEISPTQQELWTQASDPKDWANESFAITRAAATQYCVWQGGSCMPTGPVTIDDAYVDKSTPIIRAPLSKAGARLAFLLDKAFGDVKP